MTSDRMMQAIGRIERAITRIETLTEKLHGQLTAQRAEADGLRAEAERLRADAARKPSPMHDLFAEPDPHAMNDFSRDKALAALRSLDSLIDDLQKARRDG